VENQFLRWLLPQIKREHRLEVPPGDDAAVLRAPGGKRTVVTTDLLTEFIDFRFSSSKDDQEFPPTATAYQVGRKAIAVNLSDLAAMAATPEAVVVSVALPRQNGRTIADELFKGIIEELEAFNTTLAGGDTNAWDGPLVISVTAIGSVSPWDCWRRNTAEPGDLLVVTGPLGGSLLGRHLNVTPRCHEALAIASKFQVHAAIDISDGLAIDCSRLMSASQTGAIIDIESVPIHADAVSLSDLKCNSSLTPIQHALQDGEDFELLLAIPPDDAHAFVGGDPQKLVPQTTMQPRIVGAVTEKIELLGRTADGQTQPLEPKGFEHAFT
jgi:thiamine-monophosphate kinase